MRSHPWPFAECGHGRRNSAEKVTHLGIIGGNARSALSLAFLAFFALLLAILAPVELMLAFSSPSSPLDAEEALPQEEFVPAPTLDAAILSDRQAEALGAMPAVLSAPSPFWLLPLGVGTIVIGLALVILGMFMLMRE